MSQEIIHKSLHRPQLFLGVDRELCMYTILISCVVGICGYNLICITSSIVFFVVAMRYLRLWAKKDPLLRDVFLRYVRYVRKDVLYKSKPGAFSVPPLNQWKIK
ncbi:MAG: VirB3 family type IV secretion system protein [Deltaproteobacteria bacterium]|jgi:type IV secretory pathway TrbD component|nr:VirB3 family type IV secretion system protein [Deltaproteobacteria bacterium]